jgi:hypothetical protein
MLENFMKDNIFAVFCKYLALNADHGLEPGHLSGQARALGGLD